MMRWEWLGLLAAALLQLCCISVLLDLFLLRGFFQ